MKKKISPILIVLSLIIVLLGGIVLSSIVKKYTPSSTYADVTEYYNLTEDNQVALIVNNEIAEDFGRVFDEKIYLDINFVKEYLDKRFYWDSNEHILLYATSTDLMQAYADSTDYEVSKASKTFDHVIVKLVEDVAWVSADFVSQFADMDSTYFPTPSRMVFTTDFSTQTVSTLKKESPIRIKGGIKSPILAKLPKHTTVVLLEEGDNWNKVCTQDGMSGYVQKKHLSAAKEENPKRIKEPDTFSHMLKDEKICMAWHQVTNKVANNNISSILSSTKGINVLSPTWFYLNDNDGNIASLASEDYVNYCHQNNIDVWALVSNLENSDTDSSYVLTHTSTRHNLVNQIISAAIEYNLDGINLDFEALNEEKVGDSYIQFVRELSIKCENNGLVLSVDNYVPSPYTAFYDRGEQAMYADYVVIMGYDEHAGNSEEEGSVASINWVREAVDNTCKEVPAEQVILGMPFYTRLWKLTPEGEENSSEVSYKVSSKAYGMDAAAELVSSNNAEKQWLEDCGQYYAEFYQEDILCRIWLEDKESLEKKLEVMSQNKLAGAAFWKLDLESSDVWDTIIKYTH